VLKGLLIQGVQYRTYGKNVEYLDRGSESRSHACKHAFGSSQGSFYLQGSVKSVIIMLNHSVHVQVGLVGSRSDIISVMLQ